MKLGPLENGGIGLRVDGSDVGRRGDPQRQSGWPRAIVAGARHRGFEKGRRGGHWEIVLPLRQKQLVWVSQSGPNDRFGLFKTG